MSDIMGMGPLVNTQPWVESAVCTSVDPDLWYPDHGESGSAAKAICATCPVKIPCLEYALSREERWGIWGGVSANQRQLMKRRQRRGGNAA